MQRKLGPLWRGDSISNRRTPSSCRQLNPRTPSSAKLNPAPPLRTEETVYLIMDLTKPLRAELRKENLDHVNGGRQVNEHRRYQVLELFKCSRESLSGRIASLHYWNPWVSTERRRMLRKEVKAWVQRHPILQNNSPQRLAQLQMRNGSLKQRWYQKEVTLGHND